MLARIAQLGIETTEFSSTTIIAFHSINYLYFLSYLSYNFFFLRFACNTFLGVIHYKLSVLYIVSECLITMMYILYEDAIFFNIIND